MPVLYVNEKVICQSKAINQFVAHELGLYGSTNLERSVIDQVNETVAELNEALVKIKFDKTKMDEDRVCNRVRVRVRSVILLSC